MTTAVNDPISKKHGLVFDTLDADKDGYLAWTDYEALIGRFITAYSLTKDDRRVQSLKVVFQMQWSELRRHADASGDRLDREQYVTASRQVSNDTSRFNVADSHAHAVFDVIDTDGDNEISQDEFTRYLKDVWQVTAPAMETFVRIDTDGDGAISRQEFIRTVQEYHYSEDPDAPGSLLYGRV
ncbi:EF-hand domain-containing protein [Streptomyces antnestii]|uniref:EF-hand domain-containing protein n=1 Tax=Streptomyces antnestii TaxID=2494256 RepID=A0A437PV98_9ACTN|nr:EF-hand domain-containing protein [Streptomyces sp. San01]RVU26172.1 EF-hand domain-containing protein [Streptomyces sp. San01]